MGDDIMALIASVPRTLRTLQWGVQAAIGYKRLLSVLEAADLNPDAYSQQLSRLHDHWAQVRWQVVPMQDSFVFSYSTLTKAIHLHPPIILHNCGVDRTALMCADARVRAILSWTDLLGAAVADTVAANPRDILGSRLVLSGVLSVPS